MEPLHPHSADRELVDAIRDRARDPFRADRAAELLDRRHRMPLTAFASRLLAGAGAQARAEDVVQQVLLEVVRGAKLGENVRAGLFVMTRGRAIDELRRGHALPLGDELELPGGETPEQVVLRNERTATVVAGLSALTPASREAVLNQHFLGLSRRAAARRRRVTEATEATQRYRALVDLRAEVLARDEGFFDR